MRILVIEDDPRILSFLKRGLENERYAVDLTKDGESGLAMASASEYDLVILDIRLPGMDGFELCRSMRQRDIDVPILMLTALSDVGDRVRGLDSGADDYLTKPFALKELLARLRSLLRRGAPRQGPVLQVGDLTLDPSSHVVTLTGNPIDLTVREFSLLEFFMRRQGEVLSRSQILKHVWAYDFDPSSNIVDVYVRYLRTKIDKGEESSPVIRTVRGIGYRLEE